MIKQLILLILFLSPQALWAEVDLYILKPTKQHFRYIIPVRQGHRVSDEILEYKRQLNLQPELAEIFTPEQFKQFSSGQIQSLNDTDAEKILILANRGYDYEGLNNENKENRIIKIAQGLGSSKNIYVLPIAAAISLGTADKKDFFEKLNQQFAGVIALGGADVAPDLYDDQKTYSRDVNLARDFYEIEFLRHWIQSKKGFLYGICRGHQLISVALGFKLIQHVDNHGDGVWDQHSIELKQTRASHFKNIFSTDNKRIKVNSYHHQAVRYVPHSEIDLAATAHDGTVEALESFDGRILTTQFHPEYMSGSISKNIFNYLKAQTQRFNPKKCSNLFK